MSHEDLASSWSLLNIQQDVALSIREATGQHALETTLCGEEPGVRNRIVLSYAIELLVIFDFVAASSAARTDIGSPENATKYIHFSLGHLMRNIRPKDLEQEPQVYKFSIHVYVRAITSAICALYTLRATNQPKEARQSVIAAQNLVQQLPDHIPHVRPLKEVCAFLSIHYLDHISDVRNECITAFWSSLCATGYLGDQHNPPTSPPDGPDMSEIIEDCISRITRTNIDIGNRIIALLEISHSYWKSEAFLIRNCVGTRGGSTPISSRNEGENPSTVLEIRSLIQEHLAYATFESSTNQWAQCFGPSLLFMPGLDTACALDRCKCVFSEGDGSIIVGVRRRKKLLQTSLQQLYNISPLGHCPSGIETTLKSFRTRLTPPNGHSKALVITSNSHAHIGQSLNVKEQKLTVHSTIPRRPLHKPLASGRSMSFPNIDEAREVNFYSSASPSPPVLPGSRHNSFGSELLSRPGSTTTNTSSSREDGDPGLIKPSSMLPQSPTTPTIQEDSNKIAIEPSRVVSIDSPYSLEKNYPEVAIRSAESDTMSILSEYSIPMTVLPTKATVSKSRFGKLLRSKKDSPAAFVSPKFRFFASGKHIILWTKHGAGVIDLDQPAEESFTPIYEPDILHAAGGTHKFVVISRTHESYKMSTYQLGDLGRPTVCDISKGPGAIDLSRNDRYLALKYVRSLLLYDLSQPGTCVTHKLPCHDKSQPGYGNHLVSFASDSMSFMAATRFQPEKVYTYWAPCAQSVNPRGIVACSTAPFGHVDDHGLTSLTVQGPTPRSHPNGFLSTFTEKGQPVLMNFNPESPSSRSLRDHKERMGSRIHNAAMGVDPHTHKAHLVLISNNNDVFWVTDLFGRDMDSHQISVLKRPKSLKNEVQVAMPDVNEASIFWVDKTIQKGVLVKVGRGGGKAQPVYYRLDVEPMCSG